MNYWNNTIFLKSIEEAFQNKDFNELRALKERFSLQIENIHNNRIKSSKPFSPESKALAEDLDELLDMIDEKIRAIV